MAEEKPDQFIYKAVPKSAKQAASQAADSRITQSVKSGIQHYLEHYFSANGKYREQLKFTAPYSIQYEKSISAPHDARDPTVYDLQISRLWKELRARLPCILIIDQNFEYRISGLGGIDGYGFISKRTSQYTIPIDVSMTILLEVAAMDETTCSDLRDLLVFIFGPLTIQNKSHVIYGPRPQDRWEIRLPQAIEPQGLERRNIGDDQKDAFWTSGIVLNVEFEGLPDFAFDNQTQNIKVSGLEGDNVQTGFDSDGNAVFGAGTVDVVIPETVRLNEPTRIGYTWLPAKSMLVSDNPNILMVDAAGFIRPKRIGKCKIHLMDYRGEAKSSKSWDIRVVPN